MIPLSCPFRTVALVDCIAHEFKDGEIVKAILNPCRCACLAVIKNVAIKSSFVAKQLADARFNSTNIGVEKYLYSLIDSERSLEMKMTQGLIADVLALHRVMVANE